MRRDAERGVAAASDASIDGDIGRTRRLKYNFTIIVLKIKALLLFIQLQLSALTVNKHVLCSIGVPTNALT